MSEHVIQNPVPTPEQMATLLGVSPARVATLRSIMRSRVPVQAFRSSKAKKRTANKSASTVASPIRQFKMRRKNSSGVKAAAR